MGDADADRPRARDLIAALDLGLKLDDQSLPHMAFATGAFDGASLRVARVSFTGDRSYELSVPGRAALGLCVRVSFRSYRSSAAACSSGSKALMILRAEKGYIVVGKDTDGSTMPHDLGVAGPRDQRKDEYIGRRSLPSRVAKDAARKQLVG